MINNCRFIVDRRIFVVGFGMYGSIHGPSEYEVTVQLIHTLTGKVRIVAVVDVFTVDSLTHATTWSLSSLCF